MSALSCRNLVKMLRPISAAGCVLAITVLTAGCGFMSAQGRPPASEATSTSQPPPGTSASAGTTTAASPSPADSADSAAVELAGSADGRPASLRVSVAAARSCQTASDTQYAPVSIVFTDHSAPTKQTGASSNLRLDLSVTDGNGQDGIVIAGEPDSACGDISALPSTMTLQTQDLADEHQTMTVYVAASTGPDVPAPLQGVTLALRNLRHHPDDIDSGAWTWEVRQAAVGNACPDAPNSLCVPIA